MIFPNYHSQIKELITQSEDDKVFPKLETIWSQLCREPGDEDPAMVMLNVFRGADQEARLASWLSQIIERFDGCPENDDLEKAKDFFYRADGLFHLAGLLDRSKVLEEEMSQIIASLEKVWSRHKTWRVLAAQVVDQFPDDWADPAATCEEALLSLAKKSHLDVKKQARAVWDLRESYPHYMLDCSFQVYLCFLVQRGKVETSAYPAQKHNFQSAGWVFGLVAEGWISRNRFLLEYLCSRMKELSGNYWQELAHLLLSSARDRLSQQQEEELAVILGKPRPKYIPLEELKRGASNRPSYSAIPKQPQLAGILQ